jgi:hypothetical protein
MMLDLKQDFQQEIDRITGFVKQALLEAPSHLEIDSESEGEETLILERNLDQLKFENIPEADFKGKVASVDGGSAGILFGRSFIVGMYRAAYTVFSKRRRVGEQVQPLQFAIITRTNKEELHQNAFRNLTGQLPSETPEMDKVLDRLRLFEEWKLARELLSELNSGDLLLVDGSLRATVAVPDSFLQEIAEKARERGVILVGVSKSTTLYWGDKSPLLPAVVKRAQHLGIQRPWFSKVGDLKSELELSHWFGTVYIAKLKNASDFAFRVDLNRLEEYPEDKIFAMLSALARDPTFVGYPYPLAAAHQLVRISHAEVEDIRRRLQRQALQSGLSESDWDLLFKNFHRILNVDLSS